MEKGGVAVEGKVSEFKKRAIVKSLLDTDMYKFTMGQFVNHFSPETYVTFALTNRTKSVKLEEYIDIKELRWQLEQVRALSFSRFEIDYLSSLRTSDGANCRFNSKYLAFLSGVRLPYFSLEPSGDSFHLKFSGRWNSVIFWEVPALAIVNELYARAVMAKLGLDDLSLREIAQARLDEKIARLNELPGIKFMEFGTRRRFSFSWQEHVITEMARKLRHGSMIGTSNVLAAKNLRLKPMGTMAHELFMVRAGVAGKNDKLLRRSHNLVIQEWLSFYGGELSIILSDTFGTKFFLGDLTPRQLKQVSGFRQDSGDPFEFGENAINLWQKNGIDPKSKTIVFSDGLDLEKIEALYQRFSPEVDCIFGWGTNLTFDWPEIKPLSLVIKAVGADGQGLVKLSDNIAKAIGQPEEVERYKRVFGYESQYQRDCIV